MESVNSLRISAPPWWPLREGRDGKCEWRNEKCEFLARESVSSSPIVRTFGKGKCKFIANFSATMVTSLSSLSLSLSLSLSVCISLSHRKYLTHNIGSASALPIITTTTTMATTTNNNSNIWTMKTSTTFRTTTASTITTRTTTTTMTTTTNQQQQQLLCHQPYSPFPPFEPIRRSNVWCPRLPETRTECMINRSLQDFTITSLHAQKMRPFCCELKFHASYCMPSDGNSWK